MTLHELLANVPVAKWVKKVPTVKTIQEEGAVILVREQMDADTEVLVYDNGYAVCRVDHHVTVFPVHSCTDYYYNDVTGVATVLIQSLRIALADQSHDGRP